MIIERLKNCAQTASDCKYFVLRELQEAEVNEEIEKRWAKVQDNVFPGRNEYMYYFKENFFKTKRMQPFGLSISDYKEEAIKYLKDSFPFCFNIDILYDPLWNGSYSPSEKENIYNYMLYLGYYAMCLGASEEQLQELPKVLKSKKMIKFKKSEELKRIVGSSITGPVHLDEVQASSIDYYQANDLLGALEKVNDKGMSKYFEYIMKSGGFTEKNKAFENMFFDMDEKGNLFVSEGNHRTVAYLALKSVKDYIIGEKTKGLTIQGEIAKCRTISKDFDEWNF